MRFFSLLLILPSRGPQVDQLTSYPEKDRLLGTGCRPSEHSAWIEIEIERVIEREVKTVPARSHVFFTCSSFEGHLGYFYVLATVNSAVINMWVPISPCFHFFWRSIPSSIFKFLRPLHMVSRRIPTNSARGPPFPTASPTPVTLWLFGVRWYLLVVWV